jgi:hypothetical protein
MSAKNKERLYGFPPDERWLLYPHLNGIDSDLMRVENFR